MTSCRAFLSSSEHIPCQIAMPSLVVDFMVLLYLMVPIFSNVYLLISVCIAGTVLSDEATLKKKCYSGLWQIAFPCCLTFIDITTN